MAHKTKAKFTIKAGQTFSTPFESGCVATSDPDFLGNFDAYDSDGVLCGFSTVMITSVDA